MHGGLVLDKPPGMSSAAAVEHVKRALGADRAGHGGTLDPIATGVLAICLGQATKLAQYLLADDKSYEAEALLGIETDTLDKTGIETARADASAVTEQAVVAALAARVGEQDQVPPMFSAIKQGGVRLYHRARAGEEVERAPRRVRLDRLDLVWFRPPVVRVSIACSKGTYVRSVIADLGRDLGCGAHLTELRRTQSGAFTIDRAITLDRVAEVTAADLIPLTQLTQLPIVVAPDELLRPIRDGLQLPFEALGVAAEGGDFQIHDRSGTLVAVAGRGPGKVLYRRVFVPT
jgi:tRNA pseudouridine55 synthase